MPWSQTPVVTSALALTHSGLLPSEPLNAVGLLPHCGVILMTTIIHFSGLNTEPAPSVPPASYSRCRVCTWIFLLTCWLNFSQVGFSRFTIRITHWVTITNFINIYLIPRSRIYLGTKIPLLGNYISHWNLNAIILLSIS
jgi:hypothetical protein